MDMAMKLYDERQRGIEDSAHTIAQKLKAKGMTNDEVYTELLDFFEGKLPEKEIAQIVGAIK